MEVYSKILTETDVSSRLAVNTDCLEGFFPAFQAGQGSQVLDVRDENGKNWGFVLCSRPEGQGKKPVISRATWLPFVVDKQAEVGDKVEFSKESDGASGSPCRYKIRVMKKVMLFGAIIGYSSN